MRKRITLQDKKILIYEIHQGWAREHLEKLTDDLNVMFSQVIHENMEKDLGYLKLKEDIKLQLRLLEFSTRKLEPEFFGKNRRTSNANNQS